MSTWFPESECVELVQHSGRGTAYLTQSPNKDNNFETRFAINDVDFEATDYYEVELIDFCRDNIASYNFSSDSGLVNIGLTKNSNSPIWVLNQF